MFKKIKKLYKRYKINKKIKEINKNPDRYPTTTILYNELKPEYGNYDKLDFYFVNKTKYLQPYKVIYDGIGERFFFVKKELDFTCKKENELDFTEYKITIIEYKRIDYENKI